MDRKVSFESRVKRIEVNDAGEYVTIDTGDSSFYENFTSLQLWLEEKAEEMRRKEAEREEARKTESVSSIKEAAAVVKEFTQISREMHEKIDGLFGEGALQKAFPETKSPTLELAMEFVSVMAPIVEEFLRERNRKISSKYNANRKGANSK